MKNYNILKITKTILNVFWFIQIAILAGILLFALFLIFNVDFIDLNQLNGFNIHFSKIIFDEPLIYNGEMYDFSLTNGEGRLHIDNLEQKFIYLRIFAALVDSFIYLMIIYFLRKIFNNLTHNNYFVAANGNYIKNISLSIILLAIIPETIHYFTDKLILKSIKVDSVILKNEFNFEYQTLLLGLLVFVISIVFLRGIELKEDQYLTI